MGQSASPLVGRVGYSQFWEFSHIIGLSKLYYPRSIKINRMISRLIQVFFLYGLNLQIDFWSRSLHGYNNTTVQIFNQKNDDTITAFDTKSLLYINNRKAWFKILESNQFLKQFALLRNISKQKKNLSVQGFNILGYDFFFTRVTMLYYKDWVICNWTFFKPASSSGTNLKNLFGFLPAAARHRSYVNSRLNKFSKKNAFQKASKTFRELKINNNKIYNKSWLRSLVFSLRYKSSNLFSIHNDFFYGANNTIF
jgi:hypothetical protein